MESSVDRLDSGSPNLSNHYPSMENFAEPQTALENGPSNDERSGPPSESSSMVNVSTGTVEKQMTEEVEKNEWDNKRRARENFEKNWKEEEKEARVTVNSEHELENFKEWGDLNEHGNPKDPDNQKDTLVVLSAGLPEVVVDRNPDGKRTRAWKRSPSRKPVDTVDGKDVPAEPDDERPGAMANAVDFTAFVLDRCHSGWIGHIERIQSAVHGFLQTRHRMIVRAVSLVLVLAYAVYFCAAVSISGWSEAKVLICFTGFVVFVVVSVWISKRFGQRIDSLICAPVRGVTHTRPCICLKWCLYLTLIVGVILFIAIDICVDMKRLTSLGGMAVFILLGYLTSKNPSKVKWRPVIWGLGLQFILGVIILRWEPGYYFFQFLGDQVRVFLEFADEGSKFVFGEKGYLMHPMAFKVFPIVIYFSAVINIFYYWGLMQFVVCKIAWLMQFTMGTTAIESLNAACNIFIGMAESCVIMRPFLYKLTKSELHAVMTGGFATVAGSYIALLVEVGASPEHLLSAAIMSAPAALAMAKLSYPETEVSHTKTEDDVYMENTPARNLVEAASNGAIAAIKVVSSVAANLIAILGLIAFLNKMLEYVGHTIGIEGLSFKMVCSFIFWPLAAIMGVEIQDAGKVASLLGTKIFADEFISFRDLGIMAGNNEIAERSKVIATYACCGFGSIAAVGVYIGALISVAPDRRGDISEVALRAVVNGNVAGFLTACIAGILYTGRSLFDSPSFPGNDTESFARNATAFIKIISES